MNYSKMKNMGNLHLLVLALFLFNGLIAAQAQTGKKEKHQAGIVLEEFLYMKADFPSCHSVTLVELPNKELLATYFGGTRERDPDVEIRVQRKKADGTWTAPVSVANGIQPDGSRLPTWNPVLFQPKGQDLMLYYKVGPSPSEWWGEFITSKDNGHTWSKPQKLEGKILGPIKNKPLELADGTLLSGSSNEGDGWTAHIERSTDGGKSWTFIGPLNDGKEMGAIQPALLTYADGSIQMLCRTKTEGKHIAEAWSRDGGLTWSEMTYTSLPNNNSGIDAVTLKDGRQLLIYNHATRDQKDMGHKGRGVLNLAVSKDGKAWEAALVLDYTKEAGGRQYSYPSIIQTSDGLVHIIYTWHRKRIKHVVVDPDKLETYPIVDGQWPVEDIPLIESTEE